MITTCTTCGKLYEAGSEEQANEPTRPCPACWSEHKKRSKHVFDGPFIVSEYVALPGDRVGFVATDPKTGICCPGRDDRSLAEQDAEALNAAYASGIVAAAAGHTCLVQSCLALADGLEGAALLASERAERLRRSVELFRAARVEKPAIPTGRNPAACENELATAIGGVADDDNLGSLQHTPTTWIGNEQVNRRVSGGEA